MMTENLGSQLLMLFTLAIPIACVTWTVTHEEVFRESREWCFRKSQTCARLYQRKLFYLFACEYCFSHYVAILTLMMTGFKLAFPGWRGYLLAGLSLVWIANLYMSLFGRLRLDIKHEQLEIGKDEATAPGDDLREAAKVQRDRREVS